MAVKDREKIDFVLAWVDGNDPAWQKEFMKYRNPDADPEVSGAKRYRDWGNLHYWFRAVEKFAPWVNRVHLVTWGHIPEWLDTSHPKLNIVKHTDYIPAEYLPTFSANPIELNFHRIEGLAEQFVYFNDDTFIGKPIPPERLFKKGLPRDNARLFALRAEGLMGHIHVSDMEVINRHYRKSHVMRRLGKWFNFRYGLGDMFKTLTMMPWNFFSCFKVYHMAQPYLKSAYERMWEWEPETLDTVSRNRFRTPLDLNQSVIRFSQLLEGEFKPHSMKDVRNIMLDDRNLPRIEKALRSKKYSLLCFNDGDDISDPEEVKRRVNAAFQEILPEKSSYEL